MNGKTRFSQVRSQGTFQIARAGESVEAVLTNRSGSCLDFYLPDAVLRGCLEQDFEKPKREFELLEVGVMQDADIIRLARAVQVELECPDVATGIAIDSATLALCVTLIRRWSNHPSVAERRKPGLAPWKARRVFELLSQSLAEQLTLSELASSVGLSPYHFLRAFKASVGIPPHSYQTQLRMHRAQDLLHTTNLSVREIAAEVGYDDPSYLARQFRKHFGTTPAAYRRERRT